jgi:hypothetical protein
MEKVLGGCRSIHFTDTALQKYDLPIAPPR